MSDDPIDRLEEGAQRAEDAWRDGDFEAALEHYAEAVAKRLAESEYGIDPDVKLEAADYVVFERLADLARLFGRTAAADELLEISVSQIAAAGNRYWADLLHVKRIDLALGGGSLRAAQSLLDEMSPSIGDVRCIRFNEAGLKEWEQNCRWPHADGRDRATIFALLYFVMGRLLASLGQYEQSEAALVRGLTHAGERGAGRGRAYAGAPEIARQASVPLALALASTFLEKGELDRAAAQLGRLEADASGANRPAVFVQWLELRGRLGLLSGDFGPALSSFRGVLDLCVRLGFVRAAVAATLNLAHVLIFLNQTLDARRHLRLAREHAERSGDLASVARAEWLLRLARARAQSLADGVPLTVSEQWGRRAAEPQQQSRQPPAPPPDTADFDSPEDGDRGFGLSPFDLPQSDDYLSYFEESALGFHWLLGRRDFEACADYLAQLQKIFAATDSRLIKLRLEVMSGLLAYYRDDFARAEELLAGALPRLRRAGLRPELWQAQRLVGWCRAKTGRDDAALEELTAENSALLGTMAGTLAQEDRAFFLLNKWTAEEEELAVSVNRLSRLKEELARAPWHRRFGLRRRLAAEVLALSRLVDHYRHITARRATSAQAGAADEGAGASVRGHEDARRAPLWRRLLRWRGRATVSFLVLPDRVLVVRRGRLAHDFSVSPATRVEVRELVRQWHEVIARLTEGGTRDLGEMPGEPQATGQRPPASVADLSTQAQLIAERLSALIELPAVLDSLPRRTRALTVVPDDSLHGFPFAAIRHGGSYLVERYALSFAYSSDSAEAVAPAGVSGRRAALLVGASRGGGGWRELRFVPEELDGVEGWAAGRKLQVERHDDAKPSAASPDKAAVIEALSRSTLAHVACHGLFTPDEPTRSGVVLRPAEQPGVLSVRELSALDLTNLRHVTLSACWSADHFILPGRWVISLPETLARAGAASVLGCLWVVDDRVGTAFMKQFYRRLDTHTRAEALSLTQRDCLRGTLAGAEGQHTAHPIYWAGYQLYGRPDALQL